ncbi:MAG: hypothetical protein KatS3mg113_0476 [Planctomycetaceae bacterium]|nr:MAG: hypothetical protein KatS3mg113_0476 [Planctomycetaceae bacterium]
MRQMGMRMQVLALGLVGCLWSENMAQAGVGSIVFREFWEVLMRTTGKATVREAEEYLLRYGGKKAAQELFERAAREGGQEALSKLMTMVRRHGPEVLRIHQHASRFRA